MALLNFPNSQQNPHAALLITNTDKNLQNDRYNALKPIVDQYIVSRLLDKQTTPSVHPSTLNLLNSSQKPALNLLRTYTDAMGIPAFQFHFFDVTGRFRSTNNQFLCVAEESGSTVFGVDTGSKKAAKRSCALRLLNKLMVEGKLNCITAIGTKRNPPKDFKDMSLDELMALKEKFFGLNPIPQDSKDVNLAEKMRVQAYTNYSFNLFEKPNIDPTTNFFLDASKQNAVNFVKQNGGGNEPEYFLFILGKSVFVYLAQFEGEVFYGTMAARKEVAMELCASVIAGKLIKEGRVPQMNSSS